MSEDMKYEATERLLPLKIFGPNLEEVLNAAGFYKREPLTEEQVKACLSDAVRLPAGWLTFARAIERAHGIKSDE